MAYPLKAFTAVILASGCVISPALAQTSKISDYTRPYGQNPAQAGGAYAGRQSAGNRVIVNGIMQTGVGVSQQVNAMTGLNLNVTGGVSGGVQSGFGYNSANATAIGNQLNVNVFGSYNTVIVNNTQVNEGAVSATASSDTERSDDED
jgi:holdfast attachment protein HfaA